MAVVIERITAADAFDDEPRDFVEPGGNMRFLVTIASAIGLGQILAQCIG